MKQYDSIIRIVGLACGCLILIGCETNQSPSSAAASSTPIRSQNGGHLLVYRSPAFGTNRILVLSIDATQVASLPAGQNYDGYLSPGKHIVSATVGRSINTPLWQKTLNVESGQTYSFTATWQGGNMVLVQN